MKVISHRGNLIGRIPEKENSPKYIDAAISSGFEVEVDVSYIGDVLFLGHDELKYPVELEWIEKRANLLWVHCKNLEALSFFVKNGKNINFFWHQNDITTLTSKGYPWAYTDTFFPGSYSVIKNEKNIPEYVEGICTDFPIEFKKK